MYSFHRDEECARHIYDQVCDAYERIFQKLELNCFKGLDDVIDYASNFVLGF
jgi:prolyl-tRNA synthetase